MAAEEDDWLLGFWLFVGIVSLLVLLFGGAILIYLWLNPEAELEVWWVFWPFLELLGWIVIGALDGGWTALKNFKKNMPGPDKPS